MAFLNVLKKQRQSGSGILASLGKASAKNTLEKVDPRNYLFKQGSLMNALFPNVKGYSATSGKTEAMKKTISSPESVSVSNTVDVSSINQRLDVIGKNTMSLPIMMRDINVMRQGIIKLVSLSGGTQRDKADKFFQTSKERESLYESKFGKVSGTTISPTKVEAPKEKSFLSSIFDMFTGEGGFLSKLLKGGLIAAILAGIGKYFTDPEFRKSVNEMVGKMFEVIDNVLKNIFGDDYKERLTKQISDFVKNVGVGLGAVLTAIVGFKAAVKLASAILSASSLGSSIPTGGRTTGTPSGTPNSRNRTTRRGPPKKGKLGLLYNILAGMGLLYLAEKYLTDDEDAESPNLTGDDAQDELITGNESSITSGVSDVATAAAVVAGGVVARSVVQPRLDARVQSRVGGPVTFNENAQRFSREGRFTRAENEKLGKILKKLQEWFIKCSKKPGFLSLIYRKVLAKFGMGIALKMSAFVTGLVAAPITAGLSTAISAVMFGLNVYMIYQIYDWLFGDENAADAIEKELDAQQNQETTVPDQIVSPEEIPGQVVSPTPVAPVAPVTTPNTSQGDIRKLENNVSPTPVPITDGNQLLNKILDEEGISDVAIRDRIFKLAQVESSMNPNARGPVIREGIHKGDQARGLLQIMPKTAEEMGYTNQDLEDPEKSARAGVKYFLKNYERFGNLDAATVAHHAGPGGAQKWIATGSAGTVDRATGLKTSDYLARVSGSTGVTTASLTPPASGRTPGSAIAGISTLMNDGRTTLASAAPVVINAPTTNNVQQGGGQAAVAYAPAASVDTEFAKLLVSRVV